MYTILVVLVLVLIANAGAFSVMKSSSIVNRKTSMSMSMNNIPVDLITAKANILSTTLATAETADIADPTTTFLGFAFIAVAIMGSLQQFVSLLSNTKQGPV